MFPDSLRKQLQRGLQDKKEQGTYKEERVITSAQDAKITLSDGSTVLNFCANNYLGLSNNEKIKQVAAAMTHGYGMSSVRFICGTQDIHVALEKAISDFLGTEDTILFTSCFDANSGLFENFLSSEDAIISATLNHASIIDGVRLCKAQRMRYSTIEELKVCLEDAQKNVRYKIVVTDGVFSMEGSLAPLNDIAHLCEEYGALLIVDDSHAVGFVGEHGRGTPEYFGCEDKVDLITGTLGKALGGASGGYISGKKELIEWFRNTSRPYLFSNSLAPPLVAGALEALKIVTGSEGNQLRVQLKENTMYFRSEMKKRGFKIPDGDHPIVPIMLGEANIAANMADDLLEDGIYVIGFSYPVVPEDKARIRVQISAAHTKEHLDCAIAAFEKYGRKYGAL